MSYTQTESGIYLPNSFERAEVAEIEYGEGRRISLPYNQQRQTYFNRSHPIANGSYQLSRIDTQTLVTKPVKEIMKQLAYGAANMSNALDLYKQYINSGHEWQTESTADERRLNDMEERVTRGNHSMQTILNQFTYGMLIEGAFCGEVTGDRVQGIFDISPISPFEITFTQEEDPVYGVVDIIGQGVGQAFRTLQDKREPNPYFIYDPVINDSTQPWGAIPFMSAISLEIFNSELFCNISAYLKGEVFPKGYFSFDMGKLQNVGISPDLIQKWLAQDLQDLRNLKNTSSITESIITRIPVLWSIVGSMGKVSFDGVEMLARMVGREFQNAYKLPAFLSDTGEAQGIGSDRARIQMLLWLRRIRNYQRMINEAFTQWGNIELSLQGSRNECEFQLNDTDLEGERLIAEAEQLQATARKTQAEADAAYIEAGVISRQEVRDNLIENDERYSRLPNTLPEPELEPETEGDDNAVE